MSPSFAVLLVDDDPELRGLVRLALEEIGGMDVIEADDGLAAFRAANTGSFDVILLDAVMPGLDGEATMRLLRAGLRSRDVPVVFLTGRGDQRKKFLELGAIGVLAKPISPMALPGQLRALVAGAPS